MLQEILLYLQQYKGRIIGIVLGLIIGWMILHYGWLATIFWVICITLGYMVGKRIDDNDGWQDILERIFPGGK